MFHLAVALAQGTTQRTFSARKLSRSSLLTNQPLPCSSTCRGKACTRRRRYESLLMERKIDLLSIMRKHLWKSSSRLKKCNGLIQINFVDWLDFCVEIGSRALHQALRKSHCRPRPTVRFLFTTATGTHVPIETRFGSPKSA